MTTQVGCGLPLVALVELTDTIIARIQTDADPWAMRLALQVKVTMAREQGRKTIHFSFAIRNPFCLNLALHLLFRFAIVAETNYSTLSRLSIT